MRGTFRETQSPRAGIALMCGTMLIFAFQDTLSKYLGARYDVVFIVAIRFWFMALLAVFVAARSAGGFRATMRSGRPVLQVLRGVMLAGQVCIMVTSFVLLGLIETHAIFAATPLLIAALSGPFLGERVGWRRWAAIGVGFLGVLIILKPGFGVFSPYAFIAITASMVFATYSLLTRAVAEHDAATTSFFYTGVVGMIVLTPLGLWRWEWMATGDAAVLALLCVTAGVGHFLLIRVYAMAEASAVQPFSYLQLVFASVLAVSFLGETLSLNVAGGAVLIVSAGLFTIWRERVRASAPAPARRG